jgi:hypothetical protein
VTQEAVGKEFGAGDAGAILKLASSKASEKITPFCVW